MKYFFYTVLFVGSLGTAGAVMNPALVQQSAALVGLELPQRTADTAEPASDEDQLTQFLAQYPFAPEQHRTDIAPAGTATADFAPADFVPAAPVPLVVVPEAAPTPISDPAAPAYAANVDDPSQWNGEVAVPIYSAPEAEYFPPLPVAPNHWPEQAQTYPEPPPAPQPSVYEVPPPQPVVYAATSFDAPQNAQPVVSDPFPLDPASMGSASTVAAEPVSVPPPAAPPMPPVQETMPPPAPVQEEPIEDVPMYGTEMVARVGRHIILMGDILPKLRRAALLRIAETIKQQPEELRAKVTQEEINQFIDAFVENQYPAFLQEQILAMLVYNDYDVSNGKADKDFHHENIGKEFDRSQVTAMMKEFNVDSMVTLKKFLAEQLGSSLERERRLWIHEQIVRQWIGSSVQRATGECTHDEMMEFYEANKAMFTTPTRVRWQEMMVMVSRYASEQEAREKMRWMGNQAAGGAPFEAIAQANSDGFTADKGGVWDWTTQGSLTSAELEQAIFTQPVGELSPAIIQSDKGLHIIKVLEREETNVVPFVEAQVTIRDKIRTQRIQRYQEEYFTDLRRRFPMVVLKEQIDFNAGRPQTASAVL